MPRFLPLLLIMLTTALSFAQMPAERLTRGVNLSHWYAQWGTYEESRLATYLDASDVKLIKEMGFRHVRMTLAEQVVFDPKSPGALQPERVAKMKERIQRFLDSQIAVVVDLHPSDEFKKALQDKDSAVDALVKDWGALARELSTFDPAWVALEVMNEPYPNEGAAWRKIQLRVIEAMRASAPRHTIIVAPGGWTGYKDLLAFEPYDLPNLVYTFHFYDPHIYTHQSAEWGWPPARKVSHLDWPLDPSRADAATKAATSDPEAFKHLHWHIAKGMMTREWIADQFDLVDAWRAKHNVPVYLGEFGVYTKTSVREGRLRYYQAVREEAEKHKMGWSIWDYAGGFQVAEGEPGKRRADEEMLKALGLK